MTDEETPTGEKHHNGPIDYLVVEFPGSRLTGAGLAALVELVDRGMLRVLDLVFVRKDAGDKITAMAIADLDGDGDLDLAIFEGAASNLLGRDDLNEAAGVLTEGNSAAILIYENLWAAPFVAALRQSGAELVARGPVSASDLLSTLDMSELGDRVPS
ncbi:MAG TPA: DUF6325 family protein [Actinophytocola sp.]|uniref:DUF6325 family protein n=1 Tax=Actinophytocola sp. TaxID=1872138 RepID=UPI002DB74857|nr:DUF6325 family protein [Actinophytocola sp.]HEU5475621.1 DUF6325 family protein [Actinophytocola sp.]